MHKGEWKIRDINSHGISISLAHEELRGVVAKLAEIERLEKAASSYVEYIGRFLDVAVSL